MHTNTMELNLENMETANDIGLGLGYRGIETGASILTDIAIAGIAVLAFSGTISWAVLGGAAVLGTIAAVLIRRSRG